MSRFTSSYLPVFAVLFSFLLIVADIAESQRVTYQDLSRRNVAPGIYVDQNVLPGKDNEHTVWLNFRFGYEALRFRTITDANRPSGAPSSAGFMSEVEMSVEVYKMGPDFRRDRLENRTPVKRLTWRDRAFAEDYDQTQSKDRYLNGNKSMKLEPGKYLYSVNVSVDGQSMRLRSNQRVFDVPDFESGRNLPLYFVQNGDRDTHSYPLHNFGRSVLYAQDFDVIAMLPGIGEYQIEVHQLQVSRGDTTRAQKVHEARISADDIFRTKKLSIVPGDQNAPDLKLENSDSGDFYLAAFTVPNNNFQNSIFSLVISKDGSTVAKRDFRSLWLDIPTSLLNVDVAISMMELIVDRDKHRQLRRGSTSEKERKFREFWAERDPNPDTDYNPVMVEFFRRIDIAYDRFTTPNQPGYESERGKVFIRNGEPNDVRRRFPTDRPTTEVWEYDDVRFVFEATTGFGDYRLVEQVRL